MIKFEKRMEKWKEYREQIERESQKLEIKKRSK